MIIDILGYKFKVVKSVDVGRHGKLGECDMERELIQIAPTVSKRGYANTILHEVLHAVNELGGTKLDEKQIEYFGTILSEVLIRNPKFTKLFLCSQ